MVEYNVGVQVLGLQETLDRDEDIRESELALVESANEDNTPYHSALAGHIIQKFTHFRDARRNSGVENEIINCQRAVNGEYSPEDLARIPNGGANIYMHVTTTKCRAVASWIKDILLSTKKSWTLKTSPVPTLPSTIVDQIEAAFAAEVEEVKGQPAQAMTPATGGEPGQSAQQPAGNPVESAANKLREANQRKRNVYDAIQSEIQYEANHQLKKLEKFIEDQLVEGKWDKALDDFITDFSIFPTAIMKGPIVTKKRKLRYDNGRPVPVTDYCYLNKRVSPLDFYPQPGISDIDEGDCIEHMRMSRSNVYKLKGLPGYINEKIDKVLTDSIGIGWWLNTGLEDQKADLENHGTEYEMNRETIHSLHFHGSVPCSLLVQWGKYEFELEDPNKEMQVDAVLIGNEVIRCEVNDDPLFRKPYYKASFQNNPGSFWGHSVPYLMHDIQRMCNACARALADNMALASGPQVEVYIDRLADQGAIAGMHPRQIWQLRSDPTGAGGRAINFFTVPSNAEGLLAVYNTFEGKADDATGVPRYAHGNEKTGGAAQTAQGLSMMLESASKGIKDAIRNIDNGLVIPRIEYQFYYNMIGNPDLKYSGDLNVVTVGSQALTVKGAQTARRQEFLQITANPSDIEIMGMSGRADILREMAEELGLPENLVPHRLDLMKMEKEKKDQQAQQAQAQAQAGQVGLEATKIQVEGQMAMHQATQELKSLGLQLQDKKLQLDATIQSAKLQQEGQLKVMEMQGKEKDSMLKAAVSEATNAQKEEAQNSRTERKLAVDMARAEMSERARSRGTT